MSESLIRKRGKCQFFLVVEDDFFFPLFDFDVVLEIDTTVVVVLLCWGVFRVCRDFYRNGTERTRLAGTHGGTTRWVSPERTNT